MGTGTETITFSILVFKNRLCKSGGFFLRTKILPVEPVRSAKARQAAVGRSIYIGLAEKQKAEILRPHCHYNI